MDPTDIRERFDIDGEGFSKAAACLDTFPPVWSHQQSHSGLDCLIVVLRRIYSCHMLSSDVMKTLPWLPKSELTNTILTHAWHVFGRSSDAIARTDADRGEVNRHLQNQGFDPKGSFESLCTSSLMNTTFWSQDPFRLNEYPVNAETGARIQLSPDEIVKLDTLELDSLNPTDTLQRVVNRAFGIRTWKDENMLLIPSQPWVIRVIYRVRTQDENLSIQDLKTLQLPVWTARPNQAKHHFQETRRAGYYLMAVVRLRQNKHRDLVRTYNPTGSNVLFNHQRNAQAIMNGEWSVQDGPCTYMLFYSAMPDIFGSMPDPTSFPEVARRERLDPYWVPTFQELMQQPKATLPSTMPKRCDMAISQPSATPLPQTIEPYQPPEFTAHSSSTGAKRHHVSSEPSTQEQSAERQFKSKKYNDRKNNNRGAVVPEVLFLASDPSAESDLEVPHESMEVILQEMRDIKAQSQDFRKESMEEMEILKRQHKADINALKSQFEVETNALKSQFEVETNALKAQIEAETNALKAQIEVVRDDSRIFERYRSRQDSVSEETDSSEDQDEPELPGIPEAGIEWLDN